MPGHVKSTAADKADLAAQMAGWKCWEPAFVVAEKIFEQQGDELVQIGVFNHCTRRHLDPLPARGAYFPGQELHCCTDQCATCRYEVTDWPIMLPSGRRGTLARIIVWRKKTTMTYDQVRAGLARCLDAGRRSQFTVAAPGVTYTRQELADNATAAAPHWGEPETEEVVPL